MQAAAFTNVGSPDNIEIIELETPTPDPTEAIVQVEAAGLNHHDLWLLKDPDHLDADDLPFVSGVDVAGIVTATGSAVDSVAEGDSVILCPNITCGHCSYCRDGPENLCEHYALYHGGFAEYARVDASRLITLPDGVSQQDAGALPVAYMTAWHMLRRANITAGDRVFIPGATGGVGVAAVQLATVLGADTIGSSSSKQKLDRLSELGIDHTIHSDDPEEVRQATSEIGPVDATLNHLGGPFTQVGLDVLGRGGRMVIVGRTAGASADIDIRDTYWNHKRLIGSTMGTQRDLERLVDLVDAGEFSPVIGNEYSLANTQQAFSDMANRDLFGKLLIRP